VGRPALGALRCGQRAYSATTFLSMSPSPAKLKPPARKNEKKSARAGKKIPA
jgi:hypothetical protein